MIKHLLNCSCDLALKIPFDLHYNKSAKMRIELKTEKENLD